MDLFKNENIKMEVLKRKAFNGRWAEVPEGVIPLTAADSDFPSSEKVSSALIEYINEGYFPYVPKLGLESFKEAFAKTFRERKDEIVDPTMILPLDSVARAMYVAAQAILLPGDEAIVFDPVDYLFKESVLSAKATPVFFPAGIVNGKIDISKLEDYITSKTKMICLCNPHNPYGLLYTKEDLLYILELAEKYDLYIMNDEIWADIVYSDAKFLSILSVAPEKNARVISMFGCSKNFGLAGLRIGCVYCHDKDIFEKLVDVSAVMTTAGGISSLSQVAGEAALKDYAWNEAFLRHLENNRDYAYERLSNLPYIKTHKPVATFLFWIDIRETKMSSQEFVDFLNEKVKLALVPGTVKFFGPGAEGFVRLCFSTSKEILEEGINRLETALSLI